MASLNWMLSLGVLAWIAVGVHASEPSEPKVKLDGITEWLKTREAEEYGSIRNAYKKAELRGTILDLKKRLVAKDRKDSEQVINEKIETLSKELESLRQMKKPLYIPLIKADKTLKDYVGCIGRWSSEGRKDQFLVAYTKYESVDSILGIAPIYGRAFSPPDLAFDRSKSDRPSGAPGGEKRVDFEKVPPKELVRLGVLDQERTGSITFRMQGIESANAKKWYYENDYHKYYFDKPTYVIVEDLSEYQKIFNEKRWQVNVRIIDLTDTIKATGVIE